jgi:hypothetical protein
LLAFSALDCKRRKKSATREEEQGLVSVVHMADTRAAAQLIRGFHTVEQNAWRWTMAKFTLVLKPPVTAPPKGATLVMKFSVPDPVIARLQKITLSCKIGTTDLGSETYDKAGDFVFSRVVPATALNGETATVDFSLDKALPPGDPDQRELGVVVSSIGLEAK